MYIFYRALITLTLLFIISCSSQYDSIDKICLIYDDVFNNPALKGKSILGKHEIINELIKKHVTDVDAITAFVAVAQANPDDKYSLFKQAAEYALKRDWDCELIKGLKGIKGVGVI